MFLLKYLRTQLQSRCSSLSFSNQKIWFLWTATQLTPETSINHRLLPGYHCRLHFICHGAVCNYFRYDLPCTRLFRLNTTTSELIGPKATCNSSTKVVCIVSLSSPMMIFSIWRMTNFSIVSFKWCTQF